MDQWLQACAETFLPLVLHPQKHNESLHSIVKTDSFSKPEHRSALSGPAFEPASLPVSECLSGSWVHSGVSTGLCVVRLKAAGLTPPGRELGRRSGRGCGVGLQILWSGHQGTVQLSLRVSWGHLNPLLILGSDSPYSLPGSHRFLQLWHWPLPCSCIPRAQPPTLTLGVSKQAHLT